MHKILTCLLLGCSVAAGAAEPAAPAEVQKAAPAPAAATTDAAAAAQKADPATTQTRRTNDRIELGTTVVTGNRELPKVLYIVPWKKADIGELPAQPFNTLLDEALTPVDRDVFRREVTYYSAVSAGGDGAKPASAAPAARPEK